MSTPDPFRVVFVCSGNICRSPMAEIVFRWFAESVGLGDHVVSTSAGTGEWHVGEPADPRAVAALTQRGYDGTGHRARQFTPRDLTDNDLIIALDRSHEKTLRGWARDADEDAKIALLRSFDTGPDASGETLDVPDPYYEADDAFEQVLGMIEIACRALFRQLEPAIRAAGRPR